MQGSPNDWKTPDRYFTYNAETFTKRELYPNERRFRKGELVTVPQSTQRLQNEFRTLVYIAANTTIPVPKVIRFDCINDVYQLVMERVHGRTLESIVENRAKALENAEKFITTQVLPQPGLSDPAL